MGVRDPSYRKFPLKKKKEKIRKKKEKDKHKKKVCRNTIYGSRALDYSTRGESRHAY